LPAPGYDPRPIMSLRKKALARGTAILTAAVTATYVSVPAIAAGLATAVVMLAMMALGVLCWVLANGERTERLAELLDAYRGRVILRSRRRGGVRPVSQAEVGERGKVCPPRLAQGMDKKHPQ
jgi:hypothetical protein